jgi:hypothetical protein
VAQALQVAQAVLVAQALQVAAEVDPATRNCRNPKRPQV